MPQKSRLRRLSSSVPAANMHVILDPTIFAHDRVPTVEEHIIDAAGIQTGRKTRLEPRQRPARDTLIYQRGFRSGAAGYICVIEDVNTFSY